MNNRLLIDPHRIYDFVQSRVERGAFVPQAFGRAARLIALLPRDSERPSVAKLQASLRISPILFGQASAFCELYHRHHSAAAGHVFSLGVFAGGRLCGVAVVGRPVSRHLDNGRSLEITRVATDGTPNACSCLLGAARREARRRGFKAVFTYTLVSEPGTSLRAAGFVLDGQSRGGSWSRSQRVREDKHPLGAKLRWRG